MKRVRLRFERSGRVLWVAEFRRDGWPVCPQCNEDELAAIKAGVGTPPDRRVEPADVDLCYRCGPVEVLSAAQEDDDGALPGVG